MLPLGLSRRILLIQEYKRLPNLKSPRTFNEKVSYRILNDRREILVTASSKVDSKILVGSIGTKVRLPKTIWHGTDLNEIDGIFLDRPWVIKASHRSGRLVSGEAGHLDIKKYNIDVDEWLEDREFIDNKLWGYKETRKEFILEERIGDSTDFPEDLKFFVFEGKVAMVQFDHGRHGNHSRNLYDENWNPLPWTYSRPRGHISPKPKNFRSMIEIASKIGKSFDFARVDLYNIDGEIYFGELTMYPAAGLSAWPRELDELIGAKWTLPSMHVLKELQT